MAETNSSQDRIDTIHKDYQFVYGILTGILLVLVAIWIGSTIFSDTEGYLTNIFTEIIGVIATIFVIDRINQWRAEQRLKEELLNDLHSESNDYVLNALRRLREKSWLEKSYLIGNRLERAKWEGAYIGDLNFDSTHLNGANFSNITNYDGNEYKFVSFKEANMTKANLANAILINGDLEKIILFEANMEKTQLARANLVGATLNAAHMEGANLSGANLEDAFLIHTHLGKSFLFKTNLKNAIMNKVNLVGANLTEANLQNAILDNANLQDATIYGAILESAILKDANLKDANLVYARLKGADLNKAHLVGAQLYKANLESARLTSTHLEGASLNNANLKDANLINANLEGANLRNTNLEHVKWIRDDDEFATILPDAKKWTPSENMERFTNPKHPDFTATLEKINEIRKEQGREPLE